MTSSSTLYHNQNLQNPHSHMESMVLIQIPDLLTVPSQPTDKATNLDQIHHANVLTRAYMVFKSNLKLHLQLGKFDIKIKISRSF